MIRRPPGREPRGQAMVEFSFAIVILVAVLLGVFDLGRGVLSYNSLAQASREGARVASVQASWINEADCTVPECPTNLADLKANVVAAMNARVTGLGTITSAQVTIRCANGAQADNDSWTDGGCTSATSTGQVVTVRVEYTFIPLISIGAIDMASQTAMVIN